MDSLQEEARNTAMRPEDKVHDTMMTTQNTPHLAPPSKQHVGIWDTAIQSDVLARN